MRMAEEGQYERTQQHFHRYFVANVGDSGTREMGRQYLTKLESTKMEVINLNDIPFSISTDM